MSKINYFFIEFEIYIEFKFSCVKPEADQQLKQNKNSVIKELPLLGGGVQRGLNIENCSNFIE